jgi:nucleotide-binding universal stress UspA family protein
MEHVGGKSEMLLSAVPALLLRNIVVATDFSPASDMALRYARGIAGRNSSRLTLLHAIPPSEEAEAKARIPTEYLAEIEQKLRTEAATCHGLECHTRLVKGTTLEVVDQILALEHVDLIVIASHGTRGFRRFLMGEAAEQIFRHVRCPVLVIGPSVVDKDGKWRPERVLLATDLESDETTTIEHAMAWAAEHHAELALLHVNSPAAAPFPEDTEVFLRPYFQARLRRLIPSWSGLGHPHFWIEFGRDPVTETVRVINEKEIDLVVLSVHPRQTWTTHFRNDAQRMVALAPCPLLVVQREF